MATLKPVRKISARPQIKAVKQPIPRQVILPKKAQPIAKAPSIPMMAQPLPSLPMQQNTNYSQFQNPTNPIMNQSSVGTVGYPTNGSQTSIYQGQQNPVMANMPTPIMSESSVGSIGYPADGGTTNYQGQQPFNPAVTTFSGFNQPQNSYMDYTNNTMQLPAGYNTGSVPSAMPQQGGPAVMPQQDGNMVNIPSATPDVNSPYFAGFSAPNPMFNPMYNAPDVNNPLFAGFSAPIPNNMNSQGFVPMGGNNLQNTSTGSFGAIQQPMGSVGNIGSLLG